jgi:hypothetical protein
MVGLGMMGLVAIQMGGVAQVRQALVIPILEY